MTIIGIDPGASGAFAQITDGALIEVVDMPIVTWETGRKRLVISANNEVSQEGLTKSEISAGGVFETLCRLAIAGGWTNVHVVLEHVHGMPGQGNMFPFGRSYGLTEMAAVALALPLTLVDPARWKSAMGCTSDKSLSRKKASEMFPTFAPMFKRKMDDGRAEAALIGAWGLRHPKFLV